VKPRRIISLATKLPEPAPRERFDSLLTEQSSVRAERAAFDGLSHPANQELARELAIAAHAAGYTGPKKGRKRGAPPLPAGEIEALILEHRRVPDPSPEVEAAIAKTKEALVAKWEPKRAALEARANALEEELRALAEVVTPLPGEHSLEVFSHFANYSQGPGGDRRYAEARCKIDVAGFEALGIKGEVEQDRYINSTYRSRALVSSELDVEILKRKRALSLREMVRLAWKLGVNPRVYWPMLPHGFEEKEGLDFFGNDLRAAPGGQERAEIDAEEKRLLAACGEVVDVERVERLSAGTWNVYTRGDRLWAKALLLPGLVAFENADMAQAVYDVGGRIVAGPVRTRDGVADWGPAERRFKDERDLPPLDPATWSNDETDEDVAKGEKLNASRRAEG